MRRFFLFISPLFFYVFVIGHRCLAQVSQKSSASLKGCIISPLQTNSDDAPSIHLLTSDSSVFKTTRPTNNGRWKIIGIPAGSYTLLITCTACYDRSLSIHLLPDSTYDLGNIQLTEKTDSLQAVTVRPDHPKPSFSGDTVKFNIDYLAVEPGAMVEDLFRQLPGLSIDAQGTIAYYGQKIDHLLLDGVDLLSTDPTVLTRNLNARKIRRIEILDRKSENSRFTGIDDGTRNKTLNLVTDSASAGAFFGNAQLGTDLTGNHETSFLVGKLASTEQILLTGLATTTGEVQYAGPGAGSAARMYFGYPATDPLSAQAGTGIPHFTSLNAHYADTWSKQHDNLNANYQFGTYITNPSTRTVVTQIQPDTVYQQAQSDASQNEQTQHSFDVNMEMQATAHSSTQLQMHGFDTRGANYYTADQTGTFNNIRINSSHRQIDDALVHQEIAGNLAWKTQSTHQSNRIFSINFGFEDQNDCTQGNINSVSNFYNPDQSLQFTQADSLHQIIRIHRIGVGGGLSFKNPIGKNVSLGVIVGTSLNHSDPLNKTFAGDVANTHNLIDSLTTHLRTLTVSQNTSLSLVATHLKWNYSLGADLLYFSYRQQDIFSDSSNRYHYLTLTPRAIFTLTPNSRDNLSLYYYTVASPPTTSQLIPAKNLSNPLLIQLGNPRLHPSTDHHLRLDWRHAKTWITEFGAIVGLTTTAITTQTTTDSLGRQLSQAINLPGGYNVGLSASLNRRLAGIDLGVHNTLTTALIKNYVGTDLSRNATLTDNIGFSATRFVDHCYSFDLTSSFTYLDQQANINPTAPIRYWSMQHTLFVNLYAVSGLVLNTSAAYNWQQSTPTTGNVPTVILWNSAVTKIIATRWFLKISANNLLNNTTGIARFSSGNTSSTASTNILGRHYLLTLSYRLGNVEK